MLQIHTLLLEVFETVVFLLLAVESLGEKSGSALARGEHHHLQPLPEAGLFNNRCPPDHSVQGDEGEWWRSYCICTWYTSICDAIAIVMLVHTFRLLIFIPLFRRKKQVTADREVMWAVQTIMWGEVVEKVENSEVDNVCLWLMWERLCFRTLTSTS